MVVLLCALLVALAFFLGFLCALEGGRVDRESAFDAGVNVVIRQLGGRSHCQHYGGDGYRRCDQELPMARTKCHKCPNDAGCPVDFVVAADVDDKVVG